MIDYNIEFTKGVLFVRIFGMLNKFNEKQIENDLYQVIKEGGIRYLVFNIENLNIIDNSNLFKTCETLINKNDGKMLLCGKNSIYTKDYTFVENELSALKEFSIC